MVLVAHIIVDVPLMQTDRPYSYLVPEAMQEQIAIGMRVHVPFGKGNRLLQGFIIGLEEQENLRDFPELKPIAELLDYEPVLNQEQLDLADQMRHTVFSYKISILKSMLPGLLNSQYDKVIMATDKLGEEEKETLLQGQNHILFSQLSEVQRQAIPRLVQSGRVTVDYLAKDKQNIKTEKHYSVQKGILETLAISQRAKKRLELRDFLLEKSESGKLTDLHKLFSRDVVKFFIEAGALVITEVEVNRADSYFEKVEKTDFLELNAQQAHAVEEMTRQIGQGGKPFLLEGVTGSGKTEVYLHLIERTLAMAKTAIVLVPEISLTPQMTNRFISRFGDLVAIMHSGLSDGEKFDEWRKVKSGQAKVVVGARSAIFAPLDNIGAIIIDEEHEATYKQESNPRYHARDVALLRAKSHGAVLVLGSATPSIETRARAQKGVYHFLELTQRANPNAKIPQVEVVDFKDFVGRQEASDFTPPLLEKIRERLARKEQVVLMLNRRGYSSFVMCRDCGYVDDCPNCDISLTLHMDTKTMNCHYCSFSKDIPQVCPNCKSHSIRYYGTGTQKAYDELAEVFPQARILRMDVDTTRKKGSHQSLLDQFGRGEADILLGTQMIAKGLDFPNVTLVGVLNADTALNLPDFRSSERTFQLLTQVAGRAGRAEKAGQVLIQSYNPQHYAIRFAKDQDYEGFYAYEMGIRRQLGYPPYYFTIGITLSHKKEEEVVKRAYEVMNILRLGLSETSNILGPTPKPIARTHNLYHYQILIKYRLEDELGPTLNQILALTQERENSELRLSIDHEPQQFL